MLVIDIINKEIDEALKSISNQHEQVKYYFQVYTAALIGLFTISGYFASEGFSINESVVGSTFTITVFLLGWIFMSVVSHKVSMLILLYKHLAVFRKKRLELLNLSEIDKNYVLPYEKKNIRMPGLLKYLPYQVFIFNFLIFCGGLAFYIAPHFPYHQTLSLITAGTVFFGAFYPRVCITFNKHISCAVRATTFDAKTRMEKAWELAIKQSSKPSNFIKTIFVYGSIAGAILLAILSFYIMTEPNRLILVLACWGGVFVFAYLRYITELYNFKIAKIKISEVA